MSSFFLRTLCLRGAVAALALAGLQSLSAAVIPYTNDFSGVGTNTAFPNETTITGGSWTVTGGSYVLSTNNSNINAYTASLPLTNAAGVSFTMETQFVVTGTGNVNSNGITLGMGLFGSSSAFQGTSAATSYYLADWSIENSGTPGNLRIIALGDTSGTGTPVSGFADANPSAPTLAIVQGSTYTMRLTGDYAGSTLNMTLGIYDSTGNQIGTSATLSDTSPLTGTFFGYRNRIGLGGGTFTTGFDNFSVTAVPEPATAGMLAFGASMLLLRRRKR